MTPLQSLETKLELDPQHADSGGIFPLEIPTVSPCQSCSANVRPGSTSKVCRRCKGQLPLPLETSLSGGCSICHGDGWVIVKKCDECHGSAFTTTLRPIRVRVPAGTKDGQRIRLRGKGLAAEPGAPAGDLYVTVKVAFASGVPAPGNRTGTTTSCSSQKRETKAAKMDKVAKLLRKAESVAGTPEEAVYRDRAFALIAEYNLEEAMVRAALKGTTDSDDADKGTPKIVERVFIVTSKYGSHQILSFLGNALHCKGVHWKSGKTGCPRETVRIALFGMPDHLERVHFLWDLLQPQALRALDLLPEDDSWYSTASVYRRSWVVGYALGIAERLREHEQHAVDTAESGTAVVLYDLYKRDEEQAEAVIKERWPDLDAEDPSDSFDPCGIEDGKRAAWSAALNRSVGTDTGSLVCA